MFATVNIKGLDEAEQAAKEILEHVAAIRKLTGYGSLMRGIEITVDLKPEKEADSGN